jgi:glycolate dehydrogenase FAD-linked subunit
VPLPAEFLARAVEIVGGPFVLQDPASRNLYGSDALMQTFPPDAVVLPAATGDISRIAALCSEYRTPLVVRGGGSGYTGGSVPTSGGIVLSLERLNRILEIDQLNLLARVQPNVITGDFQDRVEQLGLFYPPDPASLRQSALGGNVAEGAGGPRAFKYGTTKRYVLALEAVLASGEVIRTGSKAVKNVVGYDLTQLLVGSEGTLAIITEIVLRLIPKPAARRALRASFGDIAAAVDAVTRFIQRRVTPAAVELIDSVSLEALARHLGETFVQAGSAAALIVEVDGSESTVEEEIGLVEQSCLDAGCIEVLRAKTEAEREDIWRMRRELSGALKEISSIKFNHDVVVPRGRVPELFDLVEDLRATSGLPIACFGHAGDGNIHVNIMVPESTPQAGRSTQPGSPTGIVRAHEAERRLFEGVVALAGSISGEHGIGFTKAKYLGIELSAVEIALMKRVKAAFDPFGILNPGKIFPAS